MMRIHILTPSIEPNDAVSNDALGMRRWLRRQGYRVRLYSRSCHPTLRRQVWPVRAYEKYLPATEDLLIYHHSVGWPRGIDLFERSRNRRIVRYHNVTPARFYRSYSQLFVKACKLGIKETGLLARSNAELYIADSAFNAHGLIDAGAPAERSRTVPPFHAIARLDREPLDHSLAADLAKDCHWLFVGRLSPNKGHRHLIRALGYYRQYFGRDAHLTLVGNYDPGMNGYWEQLAQEVRRWRLQERVHFTGKVTPGQLRTYYENAAYFLCASEHEGFCVPLVEAMRHGLPIVAYGSSAIPDTLGETGIAWETPAPMLLAETIQRLENSPDERKLVIELQRTRYREHFTLKAIGQRLQEALSPFLEGAEAHA
jgi:glycosyltransferase involved in cell wall biosynthesis